MDNDMTQEQEQKLMDDAGIDPETQKQVTEEGKKAAEAQGNEEQASPEEQELMERFVVNAMTVASGDHYDKMLGMAKSSKQDASQGVGRAIFFVLDTVRKGLNKKGVEIPPRLWLAEDGIVAQTSKIVGILLDQAGIEMDEQMFGNAMSIATEALGQVAESEGQQEEPQEGEQGQEQAMAMLGEEEQAPQQGQPPMQPQQQGGLLSEQQMPPQGMPQ